MVEEMQNLNKKLEETETAINDCFKPFGKEVEMLMKVQLEREEKTMEMMKTMQREALLEKAELNKVPDVNNVDPDKHCSQGANLA